MRLLEITADCGLKLTKDLEEGELPSYTILSHTWGPDEEETTFKDLQDGTGKHKKGYRKLEFCAEQTQQDGRRHFWVDTCCIDKTNNVELNTAITSMFRWYQQAEKCYVYLLDVPSTHNNVDDSCGVSWESDFRKCRWLRRGWTLQELLAPQVVEFFDKTGRKLGDKTSLERHICDTTGIPAEALRGRTLSSFSIEERMSWQSSRTTKKPEDQAYSLSGICEVSMIPIYGEGQDKAMARLRREIEEASQGTERQSFTIPFSLAGVAEALLFVGREKELEKIHTSLASDGRRRTVVLHGLGGIGKTQTAVAYARRHRNSYSAVFWFNIQDETLLKQSFAKAAKRVLRYYPSASWLSSTDLQGDLNDVVEAVKAWLSEVGNTRWLAIYDNYDNPKIRGNQDAATVDIGKFLPEADQGSVVVTTRSSQVRVGRCIPMRKLTDVRESVDILSSMSRRDLSTEDGSVFALIERLDGLPLALATAGAYLDQVTMSVADYLRLYDASWRELHESDIGLDSYEDRTLYSTWRISFDRIEQQNELAAKLLRLWCYFSNQDLWYELLSAGSSEGIPWIQELTSSLHVFSQAMRVLCNYGLVEGKMVLQEDVDSAGYSIHICVHSWIIYALNAQWDPILARYAIDATARRIPDEGDVQPWVTQRRLLPHVDRCVEHVKGVSVINSGLEWPLHRFGDLYTNQGKLVVAEELYQQALEGKEKALGAEHLSTLDTVNNLGVLYANQGKMAKAEEMFSRALTGKEKALGADHTSTLNTVNNLGVLYANQGKLTKAEEMYSRALEGYEKALGADHTSTLTTVNNLGNLYKDQGKLAEAKEMYLRALRGYEKALGADHTSTLRTVNNLGVIYKDQGKMAKAEEMFSRALTGKEKALGADHTSTLDTVNNLGVLYANQGKLTKAERMYLWALQGREKVLGAYHASTQDTVANLGILYADQGKLAEAEEIYMRALEGHEKAFGADHTSTLNTLNNLGILYANQGKLAEAERMYSRALQDKEKALGADHMSTLTTVNNLGVIYKDQGKMAKAEEMFSRALTGKEKALGADHMSTLDTVNNLGVLYADQGKLVEAEEMYKRALKGREKALGADHTSTLDTVNNLGLLYADQGKLAEAEEMYSRALEGNAKALGVDHTSTLDTVANLGALYADQGKLAEAKEMYLRALRGYEKALGADHTSTLDTVNNLGLLYADQGKLAEAEEMYSRALEGNAKALGVDHTSTLDTVANLGALYADQGKLAEAKEMYLRALRGYEKALGADHTSTLRTVNNLGILYADQGKLAEAEKMYLRALEGHERALGAEHLSTLVIFNNLGNLYADQGAS